MSQHVRSECIVVLASRQDDYSIEHPSYPNMYNIVISHFRVSQVVHNG